MEPRNSTIAYIVVNKKSPKASKRAVAPALSQDSHATSSESTPLTQTTVKTVRISFRNKDGTESFKEVSEAQALATYIVEKYVDRYKIDWPRDIKIAYRLIKKYPEPGFWQGLPVRNLISTMVIMAGPISIKKLDYLYRDFVARLQIQRSVVVPEAAPKYELGEKVGEDYVPKSRGAKSIVEFLK